MTTESQTAVARTDASKAGALSAPDMQVAGAGLSSSLINQARKDASKLSPANILTLQRTIGNQAVSRLLTESKAKNPKPAKPTVNRSTAKAGVVQRNIGLEIELGGGEGWRVWEEGKDLSKEEGEQDRSAQDEQATLQNISDNRESQQAIKVAQTYNDNRAQKNKFKRFFSKDKPIPPLVALQKLPKGKKGDPVIDGDGFQVQVEDNGSESTIEFVTNAPGMKNRAEFDTTVHDMEKVGKELADRNDQPPFRVSRKSKDFIVKPGTSFKGSLQSTVGVPLASVNALLKGLTDLTDMTVYGDSAKKGTAAANKVSEELLDGAEPSKELEGFLSLIKFYIARGLGTNSESFPKGIFYVLARTDFHKMFSMLPKEEADELEYGMKKWIEIMLTVESKVFEKNEETGENEPVTKTTQLDKNAPLINQYFNYDESNVKPPMRIETSREEWLSNMPEEDKLTEKAALEDKNVSVYNQGQKLKEGETLTQAQTKPENYSPVDSRAVRKNKKIQASNPDLIENLEGELSDFYQGLGGYGSKTDTIQYEDEDGPTETVIMELRNANTLTTPDTWYTGVEKIYNLVEKAIKFPDGEKGVEKNYKALESPRQKKLRQGYGKQKPADLQKVITELVADAGQAEERVEKQKPKLTKQKNSKNLVDLSDLSVEENI